jgi:DNA-binding Lrp family transcriptional regulator
MWLSLWLVFALTMLVWVVARQTAAVVDAGRLDSLRVERSVLEARRTEVLERVRRAESRQVIERRATELGLRAAVDSEIVILSVPDSLPRP